jgi:hypothetical protein
MQNGLLYTGPFPLERNAKVVSFYAEKGDVHSEKQDAPIDWENFGNEKIDPQKESLWKRRHEIQSTKETYEMLNLASKHNASIPGIRITIKNSDQKNPESWMELSTGDSVQLTSAKIENLIKTLREIIPDCEVHVLSEGIRFPRGQNLMDWIAETKSNLIAGEVIQK